ncbi:MAG: M15 family metallopeptidase [Frankiaceae bacterium]
MRLRICRRPMAVVGVVLAIAACNEAPGSAAPRRAASTEAPPVTSTVVPTAAAPGIATTPASGMEATVTYPVTVRRVAAADLGASWHPGCPVPPRELRSVRLGYWGFDKVAHRGTLVVRAYAVSNVVKAFRTLYAARFPIRRVRPLSVYGGDDDASMAANNTSAFNCRRVSGSTAWSQHSYGRAVDLNPVQNPYVRNGQVSPPAGVKYLDRSWVRPGMAVAGGVAVRAFAAIGWGWGGSWHSLKDYQHFSATGR